MSEIFDAYAAYYDLLYRNKDYAGEAAYVDGLIQRHRAGAKTVLELGCGTGSHAFELVKRGYAITGIDRSAAMVDRATSHAAKVGPRDDLRFAQGDLRDFRANRTFDVVLALFHVMSYQTTNSDLTAAMATAAAHLQPGGLFIFDCWYGPGVLSDLPVTRVHRLHGEGFNVTRIAEPIHHPNKNRVDVHYEILVERGKEIERIREIHPMRYLFAPEIDLFLAATEMKHITLESWMVGSQPDLRTWNACFVARR